MPVLLLFSHGKNHYLNPIEKAIKEADLGINPQNDGIIIRIKRTAAYRRAPPRPG
jgi:ribosome recycling factor